MTAFTALATAFLTTAFFCLPSRAQETEPIRGMVGVGTWATQAEFKDVKVTKGRKTHCGQWQVGSGVSRQTSDEEKIWQVSLSLLPAARCCFEAARIWTCLCEAVTRLCGLMLSLAQDGQRKKGCSKSVSILTKDQILHQNHYPKKKPSSPEQSAQDTQSSFGKAGLNMRDFLKDNDFLRYNQLLSKWTGTSALCPHG